MDIGYFSFFIDNIGDNSKLRTYKLFKKNFEVEEYLKVECIPLAYRHLFCAIRISAHDLEIERGRYGAKHVKPEDRMCKLCKEEAETEEHFVLSCPAYVDLRRNMFQQIGESDSTIYNVNFNCRLSYLFNSKSKDVMICVMKYLWNAYRHREKLLQKQ